MAGGGVGQIRGRTDEQAGPWGTQVVKGGPSSQGATWSPWSPQPIPTNWYDPSRDIEAAAGKRGAEDKLNELGRNRGYAESDFTEGQEKIGRERAYQNQDYQNALKTLAESFKRLGVRQAESANAAGVYSGGALLQAAAKRSANEALRKQPLEQAHARQEEADNLGLAQLVQAHQRTLEGLGSQQEVTERENAQSQIDANYLKGQEAARAGYIAPVKPGNQYTTKSGQVYHTISRGNEWWDVTPSGQVLKRRMK